MKDFKLTLEYTPRGKEEKETIIIEKEEIPQDQEALQRLIDELTARMKIETLYVNQDPIDPRQTSMKF